MKINLQRRMIAFAMILNCCIPAGATYIVYVPYAGGWAVGADSLRVYFDGRSSHVCKLRSSGGVVLANSGVEWEKATYKGKDVDSARAMGDRILNSATIQGARLKNNAMAHELETTDGFWQVVSRMPKHSGNLIYLDANGAYWGEFFLGTDGKPHVVAKQTLGGSIGDLSIAGAGVVAAIKKGPQTRASALDIISKALQATSAGVPDNVGPPFSVATINSLGVRWIKQGSCATPSNP